MHFAKGALRSGESRLAAVVAVSQRFRQRQQQVCVADRLFSLLGRCRKCDASVRCAVSRHLSVLRPFSLLMRLICSFGRFACLSVITATRTRTASRSRKRAAPPSTRACYPCSLACKCFARARPSIQYALPIHPIRLSPSVQDALPIHPRRVPMAVCSSTPMCVRAACAGTCCRLPMPSPRRLCGL